MASHGCDGTSYASDPLDVLRSGIPGRSTRRRSRADRSTQELFNGDDDICDPLFWGVLLAASATR